MSQTAKIFSTGRSQAVRLPLERRFEEKEICIRHGSITGDIILSRHQDSWTEFFARYETKVPRDFMDAVDRNQGNAARNPFDGEDA